DPQPRCAPWAPHSRRTRRRSRRRKASRRTPRTRTCRRAGRRGPRVSCSRSKSPSRSSVQSFCVRRVHEPTAAEQLVVKRVTPAALVADGPHLAGPEVAYARVLAISGAIVVAHVPSHLHGRGSSVRFLPSTACRAVDADTEHWARITHHLTSGPSHHLTSGPWSAGGGLSDRPASQHASEQYMGVCWRPVVVPHPGPQVGVGSDGFACASAVPYFLASVSYSAIES